MIESTEFFAKYLDKTLCSVVASLTSSSAYGFTGDAAAASQSIDYALEVSNLKHEVVLASLALSVST